MTEIYRTLNKPLAEYVVKALKGAFTNQVLQMTENEGYSIVSVMLGGSMNEDHMTYWSMKTSCEALVYIYYHPELLREALEQKR